MTINTYLVLFAVVFAVNLMPAFGPPTWSIIVLFGFNSQVPVPAIVIVAATAAALGRYLLASATRYARRWVSPRTRSNLEAAKSALQQNRGRSFLALGVFALSPAPSAQLFEAAGLTGVRLLPFTAAFFAGRLVSYSIYAAGAEAVQRMTLAEAFADELKSPIGIALQIAMLLGLVALARFDWAKVVTKR